ncbi:MAG: hypothetical protein PHW31_00740 [Candidatus Pacebacteria bacterium]|nr:hypothetical protein [Candidatus Paceibacterota bacterium]
MSFFKKFKPLILLVSVFILCYSTVWYISAAWSDAPGTPPTCPAGSPGCDAPLNAGSTAQYKTGSLGVGLNVSPTYRFDVQGVSGTTPARVATPDGYLLFGPTNAGWSHFYTDRPRFYFSTGITADTGNFGSYNEDLSLQTSGTTRLTILNSNGNVGIGTVAAPIAKLEVNGDIKSNLSYIKKYTLPVDGNWHKVASVSGKFGRIKYMYDNPSGNAPAVSSGEIIFINDKYTLYQNHFTGYYNANNNLQFARSGNSTEAGIVWVKASGTSAGNFYITENENATIFLDGTSVADIPAGAGQVIYPQLPTASQSIVGNSYISGTVGIGVTAISSGLKLDVEGNVGAAKYCDQDGLNCKTISELTSGSSLWTVSGNNIYNSNTGNVGIGTASPEQKLHVSGGNILVDNTRTLQTKNSAGIVETWMWPRWSDNVMYTNYGASGWNIRNSSSVSTMFMTSGGNVGIGTASPASQLTLRGSAGTGAPVSGGGTLFLADSGGSPANGGAIIFGANPVNTYFAGIKGLIYDGGSNTIGHLAFYTRNAIADANLTERMRITSSGNVGIGDTSPSYKLDVAGQANATQLCIAGVCKSAWDTVTETDPTVPAVVKAITSTNITNWNTAYSWGNHATAGYLTSASSLSWSKLTGFPSACPAGQYVSAVGGTLTCSAPTGGVGGSGTTNYLSKFTSGSTLGNSQVFDNGTNVGIGTASPEQKLHVSGGNILVDNTRTLQTKNSAGIVETWMWPRWSDNVMYTNYGASGWNIRNSSSVSTMFMTSGGNVGIGTASPASQLTLRGSAGTGAPVSGGGTLFLADSGGSPANGGAIIFGANPVNTYFAGIKGLIYDGGSNTIGHLAFYTRNAIADANLTERMRITSSGNVGIGDTSPSYKLDVAGQANATQLCIAGDCKSAWSQVNSGTADNSKACNADGVCETTSILNSGGTINNPNSSYSWVGGGNWNTFYTPYGYIQLGPDNANWAHIYSDGKPFIFNTPVWSVANAFSSYNNDLLLQRAGTTILTVTATSAKAPDFCTNSGKCLNNLSAIETDPIWNSQKGAYATQAWVTGLGYTTQAWVQAQGYASQTWVNSQGFASQSWVNSQGFLKTETDPIWNSQKGAYATQAWVTGLGYTTQAWVQAQGYASQTWVNSQGFASQSWVNSQGFLKTETDPIWNSQKGAYATQAWVTGLGYTTQAWVQAQNYTTLSTVQSWINSQNYLKDGSTANNLTVGKLYVTTIDPVYEIDGKKYATYVSDYAGGVRIETSGILQLSTANYQLPTKTIDFNQLKKGSDLWLFWQASSKNINDLVVILTPSFDAKVWYEKQNNKLVIFGEKTGEVSYRLSMPRKDANDWPNIINDK